MGIMKKIVFLLMLVVAFNVPAFAQKMSLDETTSVDYTSFVHDASGYQLWQLKGVAHNDKYTGVFIDIQVMKNSAGSFTFPKDIYISGDFGRLHAVALEVEGRKHDLSKPWYYDKGNKSKIAHCLVYFPRIPTGVTKIYYCEPNFIKWDDITIVNPSNTTMSEWTEASLREYWSQNDCHPIEGVYHYVSTNKKEWWGDYKYTLAVKKNGYQYNIIYLRGSNSKVWKEGEIKATFIPTAQRGLYKVVAWHMENKIVNEDFYAKFSDGFMSLYEQTADTSAEFLKLYPSFEDENNYNPPAQGSTTIENGALATTGSGVFVAQKIIATNQHVVNRASRVEIIVKDGEKVSTYAARVLMSDKVNDLALLSIEGDKFNGIGEIPYAISPTTRDVGTSIFTMGYPMTEYMGEEVKITDGIINSKTGFDGNIVTYQISAPIQPGSSGGPVFDKNGYLVGITNAGITAAQNVGYAIKSLYLRNLIESSPISIALPLNNKLKDLDLTQQIKQLSKFVVYIKVYK